MVLPWAIPVGRQAMEAMLDKRVVGWAVAVTVVAV